ncbi:MAG TPA: hypothetical protein VEX18_22450, partial [Polyangiaceae bacterium]|nr:hypothetical protein [Polyangiaceae bacterium]
HVAIVDVSRKGTAEISQELVLGVRGGPLRTLEVQGVDPDAVLVGDATATPVVRYGIPTPIPLTLARQDDGTLRIEIEREKGLFTGSYTFRFAYRTELMARDRVRRRGTSAEVEWVGPRFPDGIDVAKVLFRLPASPTTPSLASGEAEDAAMGSAFVASIRHEGGKVELELVRPHVARGEPAVWRILADPKAFDGLPEVSVAPPAARAAHVVPMERPSERVAWAFGALLVALAYAALVVAKWTLAGRDFRAPSAELRALIPLSLQVRATLAGISLAVACVLGALGDHPTMAACFLVVAMALAALRGPRLLAAPRGPGHWFALTDAEAFRVVRSKRGGRWFDAGAAQGALLLGAMLAVLALGAWVFAARSPYSALSLLLAAASLVPIFATGRASSLPVDRVARPRIVLARLKRRLVVRAGLKPVAWARIPDGSHESDELRLLVRVTAGLEGLIALEVGVEHLPSIAGFFAQPFVIVRAREDSPAHRALPETVRWQRGRRADERVAILKALLPTTMALESLLAELTARLSESTASAGRAKRTAAGAAMSRKFAIPSPAHTA